MAQSTETTQLDQANAVLFELSTNVTSQDRKDAEIELGFSRFTIGAYLKGNGTDLDTAMALIDFFKKKIGLRAKRLIA
jgi:hypothetical protein